MNDENLYLRFARERFAHGGDRDFLMSPGRSALRYAELDAVTGRMQSRLCDLGVLPGDRVMVQAGKSAEAVVLYLACLRAGAIYIPLNTAYTAAEIEYFMADAEPRLFVCQPETEPGLAAVAKRVGVPHLRTLGMAGDGSLFRIWFLPILP